MEIQKTSFGFLSIRSHILVFSTLAALIPTLGMGWLLNSMMHATITEKIEQKFLDSTYVIDREISLWFKERSYDLRVFSNSFVIAENFARYLDDKKGKAQPVTGAPIPIKNIATYLTAVQDQFSYYNRLYILDNEGKAIAASRTEDKGRSIQLPADIAEQIENEGYFRGDIYFEEGNDSALMLIGTPLVTDQYKDNMGMLAIEVRLQEMAPILRDSLLKNKKEGTVTASVVCLDDGRSFLSMSNSRDITPPDHISEEIRHLFSDPHTIHEFTDQQGVHVVGITSPLKESNWGLIIAENYDDVYAKLISSRNRNIVIALVFALIISLIAYYFSARIITPLTTLINGAQKVAGGDLEVRLPIYSKDELGLTTQVFNEMVAELQLSHNKLKELATIDSLTKLVNQKEVTKILLDHLHHYQRYSTIFSILMIDVDFFKNINDTHGHLAGDAVLEQLARIFTDTLRDVDYPGRYGGEEFLVVLSQTNGEEARICAERVRKEVKKHTFTYDDLALNLSVSIGVATVTDQDKDESSLIRRADDALYKAKAGGRDQVV